MENRLSICDKCPSKLQMSPAGQLLTKVVNQESSTYYCGECGCPLAGLTAHKNNYCKLKKWLKVETPKLNSSPDSYYP